MYVKRVILSGIATLQTTYGFMDDGFSKNLYFSITSKIITVSNKWLDRNVDYLVEKHQPDVKELLLYNGVKLDGLLKGHIRHAIFYRKNCYYNILFDRYLRLPYSYNLAQQLKELTEDEFKQYMENQIPRLKQEFKDIAIKHKLYSTISNVNFVF